MSRHGAAIDPAGIFHQVKKKKMANLSASTHKEEIGNLKAVLVSDVFNGTKFDTTVNIEGGLLCTISGKEIIPFMDELNKVISKYRI